MKTFNIKIINHSNTKIYETVVNEQDLNYLLNFVSIDWHYDPKNFTYNIIINDFYFENLYERR